MSSSLKIDLKPSRVLEQEMSSNKVDISANFEQNPLITPEDNAKNEDESSPGFKKIEV